MLAHAIVSTSSPMAREHGRASAACSVCALPGNCQNRTTLIRCAASVMGCSRDSVAQSASVSLAAVARLVPARRKPCGYTTAARRSAITPAGVVSSLPRVKPSGGAIMTGMNDLHVVADDRAVERRVGDAGDRELAVVDLDGLADDVGSGAEVAAPEAWLRTMTG